MSIFAKFRRTVSPEVIQSGLLLILTLIESLSILIAIGLIFQFFPLQNKLGGHILKEWAYLLRPTRDLLFYRIFLVTFFVVHAALMFSLKRRFGKLDFARRLTHFVCVECVILCVALIGLYQYFTYADSLLASSMLYMWGVLFVLNKLFWRKSKSLITSVLGVFDHEKKMKALAHGVDILFPIIIAILICVPDIKGLVARIFGEDLFYHFDGVIMSASWAAMKGGIPDLDMVTPYGIGMPFVIGTLSQVLGGFTYEHVLTVLITLTIFYFVGCFVLLRMWFKNTFLAMAGVLLAIKWQMFHYGATPIIWKYPNGTVVRYLFDIFFLLFVFMHGRSKKDLYLILAAICCGFSVFYVSDCGIYQLVTYLAYLLILLFVPGYRSLLYSTPKDIIKIIGYVAIPFFVLFICLKTVLKDHLWDPVLWKNMGEQISLFVQGFGAIPVAMNFTDGNAFSFLFGCVILCIYLSAVFIPVGKFYRSQKLEHDEIFAAIIGIYGLLIFHYYICQATAARYFSTSIPLILLMCYGIHRFLKSFSPIDRMKLSAVLALTAFILLGTTRLFIQYPNVLTSRGDTFSEDLSKMANNAPSKDDIAMIKQLTKPDEKVCLLGSNETYILMEADRKPFFYYFPLFESRNPTKKELGGLYLFTKKRLQKTLRQINLEKPEHVFVEKRIYNGKLPVIYYHNYESLTIILAYLYAEYIPEREGENLVALRRKGL